MSEIIEAVRNDLISNADEKVKKQGEHYFKEYVKIYGIKSGPLSGIGKAHFKALDDKGKLNVFELCDELWRSGYMEESLIACNWSYNMSKSYEPSDFHVFDRWINNYISNWATCDTFCNHTIGTFIEMYPSFINQLKKWSKSPNRWVRRGSAVSLIVPGRNGKFLDDIFEIAGILLHDEDDMVQKGYGWMLKVAAKNHLNEVFEFVMTNKKTMPRTSLRYAIEKMPQDLKVRAMMK